MQRGLGGPANGRDEGREPTDLHSPHGEAGAGLPASGTLPSSALRRTASASQASDPTGASSARDLPCRARETLTHRGVATTNARHHPTSKRKPSSPSIPIPPVRRASGWARAGRVGDALRAWPPGFPPDHQPFWGQGLLVFFTTVSLTPPSTAAVGNKTPKRPFYTLRSTMAILTTQGTEAPGSWHLPL